jgi:hypothetical protein
VNRAETYLRLLAEREIRDGGAGRLRPAAALLADADAVPEATVAAIVEAADLALALRAGQAREFGFQRSRFPNQELPDQPWQVIPVGQSMAGRTGPIHVGAVVRTEHRVFVVTMRRTGEPLPLEDVVSLTATDEAGGRYTFTPASPGVLEPDPVPPPHIRELTIRDNESGRMRLDLAVAPVAGAGTQVTESIAERVLIRRAEGILTATSGGLPHTRASLGEAVSVFQAAGLLPADSPVPGQLAALAQHLGLGESGGLPTPTELPEPWRSVLTQYARLRRPSAREDAAVTPLAVPFPGLRGMITGLSRSRLYLLMQELAQRRTPWVHWGWSHGPRPAMPTAPEVPLSVWAHDDTDHWHLVAASESRRINGLASAAFAWYPPLGRDVTSVELTVTDSTAQETVTAEVRD